MNLLGRAFKSLSTPLVADACVRLGVPLRVAPPGIRPVTPRDRLAGRAVPVRHFGSVDVFLAAIVAATRGDVLVVDNGRRADEGCIGDLVAIEAQAHGLAGIAIWGAHRDTSEIQRLGLPVFSYGTCPAGPAGLRRRTAASARFGPHAIGLQKDAVFGDSDGLVFVPLARVKEVLSEAGAIARVERRHARLVRKGETLAVQFDLASYLRRVARNPRYTFREHLRRRHGAIEV